MHKYGRRFENIRGALARRTVEQFTSTTGAPEIEYFNYLNTMCKKFSISNYDGRGTSGHLYVPLSVPQPYQFARALGPTLQV